MRSLCGSDKFTVQSSFQFGHQVVALTKKTGPPSGGRIEIYHIALVTISFRTMTPNIITRNGNYFSGVDPGFCVIGGGGGGVSTESRILCKRPPWFRHCF